MYNIMIADDEIWIIKNLTKMVNWKNYNMEIIATSTDGIEALNIAIEKKPQVLITDLRMPGLDGLELIEKYMMINPKAICVILSGYSQFPYVQKALRLGAFDYLLKPIDPSILEEMLLRIASLLQKQNSTIARIDLPCKSEIDEVYKTKINAHVTEIISFINDYYQDDLSLAGVAEKFHLNVAYLSDIFSRTTNTTFCRYLANVRIDKAKQLLLYTDYTLETIADRVGFSEYRHFIRTFKRFNDETPSQFRQNQNGGFIK